MELFYRYYGNGQPFIVLHGVFGVSDNWVSFARRMASDFEIFILDQRNHGRSPHHPVHNYFAMCDDLKEFIDRQQIRNPIILGHSMGGKVAMLFALKNPEIPKALIIADVSLRSYHKQQLHLSMIDAMMSVDFDKAETRDDIARQLSVAIKDQRILQFVMKNLYRRQSGQFAWKPNLEAINSNMDEILDGIESKNVFTKPALFIRGGQSDYITHEDFDQIYRNFSKAEIETIENAGHWLHADQPEEFEKKIRRFLTQTDQ